MSKCGDIQFYGSSNLCDVKRAGPLPPLANLTYLQYLDLSNNFLTVRPGHAY